MPDEEQTGDSSFEFDFTFADGWPGDVVEQCRALFAVDLKEVRGTDRLGALAFNKAPTTIESIQTVVRDLAQEPWEEIPTPITDGGGLQSNLQEVNAIIEQMIALTSDQDNAQNEKSAKEARLEELYTWFRNEVRPHAKRALIERYMIERPAATPDAEDAELLRKDFEALRKEAESVKRELEARKDLVAQFREGARESAGEELAGVLNQQAIDRGKTADNWFKALIGSLILALVGSIGTFLAVRPEGPIDKSDLGALGLGVFILGLLAFAVRVCAQNYRVNRHLEAVAKSKAAALSTFQRLVASVEGEDVRSAVTLTLAQAVFTTEETGLIDGSSDHVTLVERALIPRMSSGTPGS